MKLEQFDHITKEQARALFESKWWEPLPYRERALFQLTTNRLCMPFSVFHEAVEKACGRPVFSHEFGFESAVAGMIAEILEGKKPPTLTEILDLIPADKRIVVFAGGPDAEKA